MITAYDFQHNKTLISYALSELGIREYLANNNFCIKPKTWLTISTSKFLHVTLRPLVAPSPSAPGRWNGCEFFFARLLSFDQIPEDVIGRIQILSANGSLPTVTLSYSVVPFEDVMDDSGFPRLFFVHGFTLRSSMASHFVPWKTLCDSLENSQDNLVEHRTSIDDGQSDDEGPIW